MADIKDSLPGWQRRVLIAGKITLTLLISIQLALFSWRVIAPEPLVLPAPSQTVSGQRDDGIQGTAQYHLFGEVGVEPLTPVDQNVAAPETRLRLQLLGVTKAARPEASSAIIAPRGGEGDFYRIGSVVQGGTRLAAVHEDRVTLDTNGKLETLKFEEIDAAGVSAKPVQSGTAAPARPQGALRERFRDVRSPAEFMTMVTQEVATDAGVALRELGLETVGDGQGYRVTEGSMLTSLQLQVGDIVLSVNGQTLGNPVADQQLLQQVSSEGNARIEVQRGNNRFVVNHSLN